MVANSADRDLHDALSLERRLSAGGNKRFADGLEQVVYRADISTLAAAGGGTGLKFFHPRARWLADPLNGWFIAQTLLIIPVNIIYLAAQGLGHLASSRINRIPLRQDRVWLAPAELRLGSFPFAPPEIVLPYRLISELGYYSNGVSIKCSGQRYFIYCSGMPKLLVALSHLAPRARLNPGLPVPANVAGAIVASGTAIESSMKRNPPSSWASATEEYRPPAIPVRAAIALAIIVVIVAGLLFVSIF